MLRLIGTFVDRIWHTQALSGLDSYEPRHEKTCLRGFRPGKTQIGLCKKLCRGLKFWIQQLQLLYYLGSEQQKRWSDCADCAFVVRIWHKQVFSWRGSYVKACCICQLQWIRWIISELFYQPLKWLRDWKGFSFLNIAVQSLNLCLISVRTW